MGYKVFNADGEEVAGDEFLDAAVQGAALLVNGWVEDAAGTMVYESPRHRELREAAEIEAAEPQTLTGVVTPPEE